MLAGGLVGIAGSMMWILVEAAITKELRIVTYNQKQYLFLVFAGLLATCANTCAIIAY